LAVDANYPSLKLAIWVCSGVSDIPFQGRCDRKDGERKQPPRYNGGRQKTESAGTGHACTQKVGDVDREESDRFNMAACAAEDRIEFSAEETNGR